MNSIEYVLIDSYRRTSGNPTNFKYQLSRPIRNVYQIDLVYCSFSNTLLTFKSSDKLVILEIGGTTLTIVFENRSYSIDELTQHLTDQLNAQSTFVYTVTYSENNFKLNISSTTQFSINFIETTIGRQLGFNESFNGYGYYTPYSLSIESHNVLNLDATDYLLVNIDKLGSIVNSFKSAGTFFLPLTVARGQVELYTEKQNFKQSVMCQNLDFSTFNIMLLNDDGEIANCSETNMKMLLRCHYKC